MPVCDLINFVLFGVGYIPILTIIIRFNYITCSKILNSTCSSNLEKALMDIVKQGNVKQIYFNNLRGFIILVHYIGTFIQINESVFKVKMSVTEEYLR